MVYDVRGGRALADISASCLSLRFTDVVSYPIVSDESVVAFAFGGGLTKKNSNRSGPYVV